MPIMINRGKEMLRISPKDNKKIEYSTNQGRTWVIRYNGSCRISDSIEDAIVKICTVAKDLICSPQPQY